MVYKVVVVVDDDYVMCVLLCNSNWESKPR